MPAAARIVRASNWTIGHWVLFYGAGIVSAFVGQTVAHSVLKPNEALPSAPAAASAAAAEAPGHGSSNTERR